MLFRIALMAGLVPLVAQQGCTTTELTNTFSQVLTTSLIWTVVRVLLNMFLTPQ